MKKGTKFDPSQMISFGCPRKPSSYLVRVRLYALERSQSDLTEIAL